MFQPSRLSHCQAKSQKKTFLLYKHSSAAPAKVSLSYDSDQVCVILMSNTRYYNYHCPFESPVSSSLKSPGGCDHSPTGAKVNAKQEHQRCPEATKTPAEATADTNRQKIRTQAETRFQNSDKSFQNVGVNHKSSKQNFLDTNKV